MIETAIEAIIEDGSPNGRWDVHLDNWHSGMHTTVAELLNDLSPNETAELVEQLVKNDQHKLTSTGFCAECGGVCDQVIAAVTSYREQGLMDEIEFCPACDVMHETAKRFGLLTTHIPFPSECPNDESHVLHCDLDDAPAMIANAVDELMQHGLIMGAGIVHIVSNDNFLVFKVTK